MNGTGPLATASAAEDVAASILNLMRVPAAPPLGLLFLYCTHVVLSVGAARGGAVASLVACCLAGFGGSLINPALLGVHAPPLEFDAFVLTMTMAWWLQRNIFFGQQWADFLRSPLVAAIVATGFEIIRCLVMFIWYEKALAILGPSKLVGPVICGTIGGAGGLFLPWNKGLEPIQIKSPWNLTSAFFCVAAFHYMRLSFPALQPNCETVLLARAGLVFFMILWRLFPSSGEGMLGTVRDLCLASVGLHDFKHKTN